MIDAELGSLAGPAGDTWEHNRKHAIDAALDILPKGESSGVCGNCGKKIEPVRLALLPGTTQCAACAHANMQLATPAYN